MTHRKGPKPARENSRWTDRDVQRLDRLAEKNTPTPLIADSLGRSEDAIRSKASNESISLKPTNKSPYNRRKK